ncbi:MAG: putative transrane protein [Segetibacter sp.]|nr:putative transrane protein [Segetibacter sp.]
METLNTLPGNQLPPNYVPTSDEKTMAILSHILTIVAPIIAPLIIYLIKKDESKYIESHARESLNFQLTMMIVVIGLFITIIGILLVWIVGIVALVFVIIATISASEGKLYKYPFSFRIIKP